MAALISATGAPNSLASSRRVHRAAARFKIVRHIEDDQRGQFQAENRRRQNQVAAEIGAIQYQQHGVGLGNAGHRALQHVARHLLVFRARIQAVYAGQIDQNHFAFLIHLGAADALFHGDAGKIGNLLAQAGEAVKERGFAGIRRTDDRHYVRAPGLLHARRSGNRAARATMAIAHGLGSRTFRCASR